MTLNEKLSWFMDLFADAAENVYHYWRVQKKFPCIVWQEQAEDGAFSANNKKTEQGIAGTLDYFTKTEFDPIIDEIQKRFAKSGMLWELQSVQYEEETNLIHYEWSWVIP